MLIQWMQTLSTADTVLLFFSLLAIFVMLAIPFVAALLRRHHRRNPLQPLQQPGLKHRSPVHLE